MYRSRLSHSRSKYPNLKNSTMSTIDLLHNGLKRKVSQNDYKSIYPKMKICARSQISTFNVIKNQYHEEHLQYQVLRMREDNRRVEEENDALKTTIRRENKINELFNKRKEEGPLQAMPLEKLMELKLILESQQLEQKYTECENRLKEVQEQHKHNKNELTNSNLQPQITLYSTLYQMGLDLQSSKDKKSQLLDKKCLQLHKLKINSRKLKQVIKNRSQQLKQLQDKIEKQKKNLPANFDLNISSTDSGLHNLPGRSKPIEQIQSEIERIKAEEHKIQAMIQNQMDIFIKQKLTIYKEMDQNKEHFLFSSSKMNKMLKY